jgi:hemerythrin-like domain-containing protein
MKGTLMTQDQLRRLVADLESEHRLLEQQLRCLREVAESLLESGNEQCEQELEALYRLDHFFRSEIMPHFAEEETGLFQVLREQAPEGPGLVAELEQEHVQLREQFESFGGQVAALRHAGAEGRAPFLSGLTRTCWEIWHMLRAHADRESRAITDRLLEHIDARAAERQADAPTAGRPDTSAGH